MALVPALLALALLAPVDPGDPVDVLERIPDAVLELRYATADNMVHKALYPKGARCLLRRDVTARLARAAERLRPRGLRFVLWDCYRPLNVQIELWRRMPKPGYVADPRFGSLHNRAAAVDLTLANRDGSLVEMPTDFDTFDPKAHAAATGLSTRARAHREILRAVMEGAGFRANPMEWWHFEAPDCHGAPLLDEPLVKDPITERAASGEGDRPAARAASAP